MGLIERVRLGVISERYSATGATLTDNRPVRTLQSDIISALEAADKMADALASYRDAQTPHQGHTAITWAFEALATYRKAMS